MVGEETRLRCSEPLLPWRSVARQLKVCRLRLNGVRIMMKAIYSVIVIVSPLTITNQYFIACCHFSTVFSVSQRGENRFFLNLLILRC